MTKLRGLRGLFPLRWIYSGSRHCSRWTHSSTRTQPLGDGSYAFGIKQGQRYSSARGNLFRYPAVFEPAWTHAFQTDGSGHEGDFIRAIRLVLGSPVLTTGSCFVYRADTSTVAPLGSMSHPELMGIMWPNAFPSTTASLDFRSCDRISAVAERIRDHEQDELILFALNQLLLGDAATSGRRKVFEYVIGIETLLLPDSGELRFRFAVTLSQLLALSPELGSRVSWFDIGFELYGMRNEYAHGNHKSLPSGRLLRNARWALRLVADVALQSADSWHRTRKRLYRELIADPGREARWIRAAAQELEMDFTVWPDLLEVRRDG